MPRFTALKPLAAGLCMAFAALSASATIVSGAVTGGNTGGIFVKLSIPINGSNSVGNDDFNSPNLYGFDESQNILLAATLNMDIGGPVAAGTQVASHYVFFDPATTNPAGHIIGTVDFDSDILGIITSTGLLLASDILANTSVHYQNPAQRGLEAGDSVTISNTRQIKFDTFATSPGDYVRVITAFSPGATVPEPASIALTLAALAGVAAARRRRG
ncbi:MAG: PEP-CTERM sorting domain-containing protein [Burkholderiales bacterium]|nr:PEP-CTERM sorting domain-containing protein [Burkholderiales bacterium]